MDDVVAKLKAKGREVLVVFTATAILLSAALPLIGDMILILFTGVIGWFLSSSSPKSGE